MLTLYIASLPLPQETKNRNALRVAAPSKLQRMNLKPINQDHLGIYLLQRAHAQDIFLDL